MIVTKHKVLKRSLVTRKLNDALDSGCHPQRVHMECLRKMEGVLRVLTWECRGGGGGGVLKTKRLIAQT